SFLRSSAFHRTAPPDIYTLSLHDALPISHDEADRGQHGGHHPHDGVDASHGDSEQGRPLRTLGASAHGDAGVGEAEESGQPCDGDRKSTRLNSSHLGISYAVFCLKKKKTQ